MLSLFLCFRFPVMKTVTGQELLLPLRSKFRRTNVGHSEVSGRKGLYEGRGKG